MPGLMPFHEFKRKMNRCGVIVKQGRKATHFKLIRKVGDTTLIHGFAKHGNEVKACYVASAKKALRISDEEFEMA